MTHGLSLVNRPPAGVYHLHAYRDAMPDAFGDGAEIFELPGGSVQMSNPLGLITQSDCHCQTAHPQSTPLVARECARDLGPQLAWGLLEFLPHGEQQARGQAIAYGRSEQTLRIGPRALAQGLPRVDQ